jgi:frataxin
MITFALERKTSCPFSHPQVSRPFSSQAKEIDEATFHEVADKFLGAIEGTMQCLEDSVDGFDISMSMGVLTMHLGSKGTYVLNKQTPNRQIWWSSPISGPRRYFYDSNKHDWVNTRDGNSLLVELKAEIKKLTNIAV